MIYIYYKKEIGNYGESLVTNYLENNNYEIIERNFQCKSGEIDIIAIDKTIAPIELVFFEVKTRTQNKYGSPAESVDYTKIKHIYKVAKYYLYKRKIVDMFCRFDVIEVFELPNQKVHINHIKKAIIDSPVD